MKLFFAVILILLIVVAVYTHSGAALEGNTPMPTAQEKLEAKKDLIKQLLIKNKYFKVKDETGTMNRGEMKELLETLMSARRQIGVDLDAKVSDVTNVNILPFNDQRAGTYTHINKTMDLHLPKAKLGKRYKISRLNRDAYHEYTHTAMSYQCACPAWFQEGVAEFQRAKAVLAQEQSKSLNRFSYKTFEHWSDFTSFMEKVKYGEKDNVDVRKSFQVSENMISYIVERKGIMGVRRMIKGYQQGKQSDKILREVMGMDSKTFLRNAYGWMAKE